MNFLVLFLKGAAMGAANVIPGVSGGTIAFVTGIYERLINALKNLDLITIKLVLKFDIKGAFERVDGMFLLTVLVGISFSILSLAKVLEWAFLNHESLTLSFFFGLILASILGVGRQVTSWKIAEVSALIIGALIAIFIAFLPPSEPNASIFYIFLCGIVAVCSMILPGLSGSYILLLMGNYVLVLQAISAFDFAILIPLLIGCVLGLALFSRLLSYLFSHYKNVTISLLTGFVIGSLLIIWPWKLTQYEQVTDSKQKAIGYEWLLPQTNSQFLISLLLIAFGFLMVWLLDRFASRQSA